MFPGAILNGHVTIDLLEINDIVKALWSFQNILWFILRILHPGCSAALPLPQCLLLQVFYPSILHSALLTFSLPLFFWYCACWPFWQGGLLFPFHFCSLSVVEPSWAFVLSSIANRPLLCVLEQRVMYQRVKSVPPSPPNVPPSRFIPLLPAAYHLWRIYKAVW